MAVLFLEGPKPGQAIWRNRIKRANGRHGEMASTRQGKMQRSVCSFGILTVKMCDSDQILVKPIVYMFYNDRQRQAVSCLGRGVDRCASSPAMSPLDQRSVADVSFTPIGIQDANRDRRSWLGNTPPSLGGRVCWASTRSLASDQHLLRGMVLLLALDFNSGFGPWLFVGLVVMFFCGFVHTSAFLRPSWSGCPIFGARYHRPASSQISRSTTLGPLPADR